MKISHDAEVDALSITFIEATVATRELGDGIAADFDADGNLAGIEILDVVKRTGSADVLRQVVLEGIGLRIRDSAVAGCPPAWLGFHPHGRQPQETNSNPLAT